MTPLLDGMLRMHMNPCGPSSCLSSWLRLACRLCTPVRRLGGAFRIALEGGTSPCDRKAGRVWGWEQTYRQAGRIECPLQGVAEGRISAAASCIPYWWCSHQADDLEAFATFAMTASLSRRPPIVRPCESTTCDKSTCFVQRGLNPLCRRNGRSTLGSKPQLPK